MTAGTSNVGFLNASPTPTSVSGQGGSPPTCQNCATSTTPLWRRDEIGSVLCNACGLFLKLHGRPRPISLKTDVIKSRNRVKTNPSGPGGQKKKSLFEANGLADARSQAGTPPPGAHRRTSQKSANGHSDGSNSPISRTATPSMYGTHLQPFDGTSLADHQFHIQHSPSLAPLHLRQPSPGRSDSSMNGNNNNGGGSGNNNNNGGGGGHSLDIPQTYEQLIASNASLKTRVSELEVINELFRGRVTQLEQDEANARRGEEMRRESEQALRAHLEESQRRENQLKRRLDDLEREGAEEAAAAAAAAATAATGSSETNGEVQQQGGPKAKKMRVADMVGEAASESSTPPSVT